MILSKVKKAVILTAIILTVIVVLIIGFISPIAKYLIEKNSVKYLGREIKIGWLYLNPFTGYIHIGHLKVYEARSDSLFLTADGLSAKFELLKAFHKTYEISSIVLDKPTGYIIQNNRAFNFSDIIDRFTPAEKSDTSVHKERVHFNILKIAVSNGEFHYSAPEIPINYFIKNVNIESSGKWWNVDSMIIKFAMQSGPGSGDVKGNGTLNFDSLQYRLSLKVTKFDLSLFEQYLHGLANYGHLAATLDLQANGTGSMKQGLDLDATAFVVINDFHFGKKAGDDFASFDKLVINAQKISPKNFIYYLDSVMVTHPYFKYERYDYLNNIERMFGQGGSRIKQASAESDQGKFNLLIELARYMKKLGENFLQSYYKIGKIAIYNGDLKFNDYSLRNKFSIEAYPLFVFADSIDKNNQRFKAFLSAGIKPYGNVTVNLSLDPNDFGNFDVGYKILKVPISMFNPYVVSYTSFPLDRGTLEFHGTMAVDDSIIKSENHLLIIDPRVAQRVKKKDTKWIPVPLIMSFARSAGNVIDFQIPITGSLNNPRIKFWGIIGTVLCNIFIKPPSTAYLIHVKQIDQEIEKSLTLAWPMRQAEQRPGQEKFIRRMADFMQANKDAVITITSLQYAEMEKENILLFEAKKKYFLATHIQTGAKLSEVDSITIDKMSVKDALFIHYLDKTIGDSMLFTVQEKCNTIIDKKLVNFRFAELLKKRKAVFKGYFGDAVDRIKFSPDENSIPFNGFSHYQIVYNVEVPKRLLKSYSEMMQLNDEAPRKKYEKERKIRQGLVGSFN